MVGVLVFVDEQEAGPAAGAGLDLLVCGEELDRQGDQVVEVDARGGVEQPLVTPVEGGDLLLEEILRLGLVGRRIEELVLGGADVGEHGAGGEGGLGEALGGEGLLDEPDLVAGVEDVEVPAQAHPLAVAAHHHQAVAVEGADGGGERVHAEQVLDPVAHLAGRLVGEGHGGDGAGIDAHLLDEPVDAVGDDPGLARPRAGEDELRPLAVGDGRDLLGVQLAFELLGYGLLHAGILSERVGGWQGGRSHSGCLFGPSAPQGRQISSPALPGRALTPQPLSPGLPPFPTGERGLRR